MNKHKIILGGCAVVALSFAAGIAVGAQMHMEAALSALQTAKAELAQAEHNKGGHRAKAAKLVDDAIHQVREGIRVGAM